MSDPHRLIETEHGPVSVGMAKLYERPEPPLQIHGNFFVVYNHTLAQSPR